MRRQITYPTSPTSTAAFQPTNNLNQVRGYAPHSKETTVDAGDVSLQQQSLVQLAQQRQELTHELAGYAAASAAVEAAGANGGGGGGGAVAEGRVDGAITINKVTLVCELALTTSDESVIKVGGGFWWLIWGYGLALRAED